MITKILPPQKNREINYDNKGSATRLVNYFEHEAKELNLKEPFYFSQDQNEIRKEEVILTIDTNIKGLKRNDPKFVSLVISPSEDELRHLKGDDEKLKAYTRTVMENYANDFVLKDGKQLKSSDLVWYGIVHQTRRYQWDDKEVGEGKAQKGEIKPGQQTHVHIIVSTRDQLQKITINPNTRKDRFNIIDFQKKNAERFQAQFKYTGQTHYHQEKPKKDRKHIDQARYLESRLTKVQEKYDLSESTIKQIRSKALGTNYSKEFYTALKNYTKRIEQKIGHKEDLAEFSNLKIATQEDRRSARQNSIQSFQSVHSKQMSRTVELVLNGASDSKDDDKQILQNIARNKKKRINLKSFNL